MQMPTSQSFSLKQVVERSVDAPRLEYLGYWPTFQRFLFRQVSNEGKVFLLGVGTTRRIGSVRFECPELMYAAAWNPTSECLAIMYRRQVRLYSIRERRLEILGMRTLPYASPALTWVDERTISLAVPPVVLLDIGQMSARILQPNPPIRKLRRPPRVVADSTGTTLAFGATQGCVSIFWEADFRRTAAWGEWDPSKAHHIHKPKFSSDGRTLVVAPRPRGPEDKNLTLRIGPSRGEGPVREVPAAFPMTSVDFVGDLSCYFAPLGIGKNKIGMFETETAKVLREFPVKEYPRSINLSADDRHMVVTYAGGLTIFEIEKAQR